MDRFGSDPGVIGRTIVLDGRSCEVVGVMPTGFDFPTDDVNLWLPLVVDPGSTAFQGFNEEGIARLAPGVTADAAEREIQSLIPRLTERYPDLTPALLDQMGLEARVRPYLDDVVGQVRSALWILLGTVGFVLLIACANVANLMLVRAEGRRRETAVRSAIGARPRDLVLQHLVESVSLTTGGAILGLGLAWQGLRLVRHLGAGTLPRLDQVGLDGSVLLVTVALTGLAAVVFALIPVLRHRSLRPAEELRDGTRSSTRGRKGVLAREILVAGQVALALVLLLGSGLMVRSFAALTDVDPGFDANNLLTFRLSLPPNQYRSPQEVASFHQDFLDRLRALPGVQAAGAVSVLPVGGMSGINGFYPAQDPPGVDEMASVLETRGATPGYFEALGIPLLQGRGPAWSDGADGRNVVLLSRRAVEVLFGGTPGSGPELTTRALAAEIVEGVSAMADPPTSVVVGVVGDVHNASLADEPMGTVYYAPLQAGDLDRSWLTRSMTYAIRTSGQPTAVVPSVRTLLGEIDPHLPLSAVQTMEARLADSRARTTFTLIMLAIASFMGLILGAVGLYGVISHVTARRTREIGLRMALGAERSEVRGMVLRRGMFVASLGILGGLCGGWTLSRWLRSLLYGVQPNDPLTYGSVTVVLLMVAFLATWIPAARASRVEAMEALRWE
jgi:predicted permease